MMATRRRRFGPAHSMVALGRFLAMSRFGRTGPAGADLWAPSEASERSKRGTNCPVSFPKPDPRYTVIFNYSTSASTVLNQKSVVPSWNPYQTDHGFHGRVVPMPRRLLS